MLPAMKRSAMCPECEKLEREYQLTIAEIYSVVDGRSGDGRRKIARIVPMPGCSRQGREGVLTITRRLMQGRYAVAVGQLSFQWDSQVDIFTKNEHSQHCR
jgi:hypothetical protein